MNREQRRKAEKKPLDAKTLKAIIDDAVENTKKASFQLFMLALAKSGKERGISPEESVKFLKDIEVSIDELQVDEKARDEIFKYIQSARIDEKGED